MDAAAPAVAAMFRLRARGASLQDCADVLEDSIRRIFTDDSVSEIFAGENQLF